MCFLRQLCQEFCAPIDQTACIPCSSAFVVQCAPGFAYKEVRQCAAGDVERAQELVFNSRGIQRARDLAAQHAQLAAQAVSRALMAAHLSAAVLCCISGINACPLAASCLPTSCQLSSQQVLAREYSTARPDASSVGGPHD